MTVTSVTDNKINNNLGEFAESSQGIKSIHQTAIKADKKATHSLYTEMIH